MFTIPLRFPRSIGVVVAGMLLAASHLASQAPPERRAIDSLFVAMSRATAVESVPATSTCEHHPAQIATLCRSLLMVRRMEFSLDRHDGAMVRDTLEHLVHDQPHWPVAWYALGILRVQLARAGVVAREGPLLPTGVSNEAGATNALVRALELDPGFSQAAEALARAPMPREGASRLGPRLAMLRRLRSTLSGPALYGSGLVELEGGTPESAAIDFLNALDRGGASPGLVNLQLARAFYWSDRPMQGRDALLAGVRDSSEAAQAAYRSELEWVASPEELAAWDSLPAARRPDWLAAFWADRDVADGREDGARLVEHYARLRYALANYRISVPRSGRQRAGSVAGTIDFAASEEYARLMQGAHRIPGVPGVDESVSASASGGADAHPRIGHLIREANDIMADLRATAMSAVPTYDATNITLTRGGGDAATMGQASPFSYFRTTQDLLDDRGIVYIRQGPPDATARTVGGIAMELWVYRRPERPLILSFQETDFDGTAGASMLVPTLLTADPLLRDQLCHLDTRLCSSNADPRNTALIAYIAGLSSKENGAMLTLADSMGMSSGLSSTSVSRDAREASEVGSGARLKRSRESGLSAMADATTTDAFPLTFTAAVHPIIGIYGLVTAAEHAGRLVVPFALRGEELVADTTIQSSGGTITYPVRLQVMASSLDDGRRFELDTVRFFTARGPFKTGEFLSGVLEVPVPPGRYTASVVVAQRDGRGALAHLPEVRVPDAGETLLLGDLVFGRANSGVRWNSGKTAVPLNPLNAYRRNGNAEVYFQLAGLNPGTTFDTRFEFFRSDDDPKHAPRLSIASSQVARASWVEVQRTLGLENLPPGTYRVRLTVTSEGKTVISSAWMTVAK